VKRPHVVIVDSLRGSHKQDENSSRVAFVLEKLAGLVQRTKVAGVFVHHTKKLFEGEAICPNSSRGSNAIFALARVQIGLDRPDPRSDWTRVQMLKENLGLKPKPLGFRFGERGLEFGAAPEEPKRRGKIDEAAEWLAEHLKDGKAHRVGELIEEAEQFGIAKRTLQRAAVERLGIRPEKQGQHDWWWKMPKK